MNTSIVKINISKLHQAATPRTIPWKHSKVSTKSLIVRYVIKNRYLRNSYDVKIVILSGVL